MHLTQQSTNRKTGPIPVSISPAETCPSACPFRSKGCYAKTGPLSWTWRKHQDDISWQAFLTKVRAFSAGQIWRHNQAGDLPGEDNTIDHHALAELVAANRDKRGFAYTHKPVIGNNAQSTINRAAIRHANMRGFCVNLSADNLADADAKAATNCGPVVVVLPSDAANVSSLKTPAGRHVVVCPATRPGASIQCAQCGLCAVAHRKSIVGFPAHGAFKRSVSETVKQ